MERNTFQKTMIVEALHTLNHPTAENIYAYLIQKCPHISKGTVYRNLSQMAQNGQILQVKMPDGPDHFDHTTYQHYHCKCVKCGCVFDVDVPYQNELNLVQGGDGFVIQNHSLHFSGLCAECNNKQQMEEEK